MGKLIRALFVNGLIVGLLGIPVSLFGLLIFLISGSWTTAHAGLWMMGGGFVACLFGMVALNYTARRIISREGFGRFVERQAQSGEVIDVQPIPEQTNELK